MNLILKETIRSIIDVQLKQSTMQKICHTKYTIKTFSIWLHHNVLYSQSRDVHKQKNEALKVLKYNDMTGPSPEIPIHHENNVSFGVDENI